MTADLSALIARLEAAEVGSRELDGSIFRYFGEPMPTEFLGRGIKLGWQDDGTAIMPIGEMHVRYEAPAYSTSIDDALALAEKLFPHLAKTMTGNAASGFVAFLIPRSGQPIGAKKTFTHPALAMSVAILRAKQGEGE